MWLFHWVMDLQISTVPSTAEILPWTVTKPAFPASCSSVEPTESNVPTKQKKKTKKKNFSYACLLLRASLKRSVKSKGFNPVSRFEALTWCMLCFGNQPPLTYWLQQQTLTLKKKQNPINGCKQKWPTYVWSNMEKNASQNHINKIWWRMTTIRMIQL